MFSRVTLKNFRCFLKTEINFKNRKGTVKPVVLLVGDNGTGKSALISSFIYLKELTEGYLVSCLADKEAKTVFNSGTICFDLSQKVDEVRTIGVKGNVETTYEFVVRGNSYRYELVFDENNVLILERLSKKQRQSMIVLLEMTLDRFNLGKGLLKKQQKDYLNQGMINQWGTYTLLSMLLGLNHLQKPGFKNKQLSHALLAILQFISDLRIQSNDYDYDYQKRFNIIHDKALHVFKGVALAQSNDISYLKLTEPALKSVIKWLCPTISDVAYEYEQDFEFIRYQLYVTTIIGGKPVRMPIQQASTGVKNVTKMIDAFFAGFQGKTIIIDDIDDGLHIFTIQDIISGIANATGQVIFSFHSIEALDSPESSRVYLSRLNQNQFSVVSIDDILLTQVNHNNKVRYEKGQFGRMPRKIDLTFRLMVQNIYQQIMESNNRENS